MARKAQRKAQPSDRYLVIRNSEVYDEYDTLEHAQEYAKDAFDDLDPAWDDVVIAKIVSKAKITSLTWE